MTTTRALLLLCLAITSCYAFVWNEEVSDGFKLPEPRYHHTMARLGDRTLVMTQGFEFKDQDHLLNDTWSYDVITKGWNKITPLNNSTSTPLKRAYATLNSYGSHVVLYGGFAYLGQEGGPIATGDVWRFSQRTTDNGTINGTWVQDEPFDFEWTFSRYLHASAVVGNELYTSGGLTKPQFSFAFYNLDSKVWNAVPEEEDSPRYGRLGHTLTALHDPVLGEVLVFFGGYTSSPYVGGYSDTWLYVINKAGWIRLSTNPVPVRYSHEAFVLNNTLYIYGGLATFNTTTPPIYDVYYDDIWALTIRDLFQVSSWTRISPSSNSGPGSRQGHKAAVIDNVAYSMGGYVQGVGLENDMWSFRA